jgi:hypothetical protein
MKFTKLAMLATAPAIALAATSVAAQDVGTTIYSQVDGSEVGTIDSNDGTNVILNTGNYEAALPGNYLAQREGKWTINATKEQIDAMMAAEVAKQEAAAKAAQAKAEAERQAKLDAALVVGAQVVTVDDQPLGLIDEIKINEATAEEEFIVVKSEDEQLVTLPINLMTVDAEGSLIAMANYADIMAALEAAGG